MTVFSQDEGVVSRCDCGATSPATTPDLADAWEFDHAQWHCPIDTTPQWDEVVERWTYPHFPGFTRVDALIERTTDARPPSWSRHRRPLRIETMRAYLRRVGGES